MCPFGHTRACFIDYLFFFTFNFWMICEAGAQYLLFTSLLLTPCRCCAAAHPLQECYSFKQTHTTSSPYALRYKHSSQHGKPVSPHALASKARAEARQKTDSQLQLEAVFKTATRVQRQQTSVMINRRSWFRLFLLDGPWDACGEALMGRFGGATRYPVAAMG